MSHGVVLTADRTLMSSYTGSQFIGFAACFPKVLPKWLYTRLFCPQRSHLEGRGLAAPAGLRKVEAALVGSGIPADDISVVHPTRIDKAVDAETKVIGISTSDPMGMGPASSTFSSLLRKEPYTAFFFRELMESNAVSSGRAKVIVGGPGAWQLADGNVRDDFGIDCLVEGEGDLVAPHVFRDAIEGRALPDKVSGGAVPIDQVPLMAGPSVNGTVEVSRGCGRGCEFCNPNMRTVRHIPLDRILKEVRLNLRHSPKITLHAEDVLRYKARGMKPDLEEVTGLFTEVTKLTPQVGLSHIALSSALAEPRLVEDLAHILSDAQSGSRGYAQTGIETGSPRLVSEHMKGKARPFEPGEWPEVVRDSLDLLTRNDWVVCATLVLGMPGERAEDVQKTLDLVRDLRESKGLIVPLFFVPLGQMTEADSFTPEHMLPEHWMLLAECIDHDFYWTSVLMDELFAQNRMSTAKTRLFKLAAWYMQRRLRPYLEYMQEGRNPLREMVDRDMEDYLSERPREGAKV